jgi:hypothetical protein
MIPEIEAIVEAYQTLYRPERPCGCTKEHRYPNNVDSRGMPAVCLAHEWDRQQDLLQSRLTEAGLSMPIPPAVNWDERADWFLAQANTLANPASRRSKVVSNPSRTHDNDGAVAATLAWHLAKLRWEDHTAVGQHIVASLDRTMVITAAYERRETEMRNVLAYAPVLVFWDNQDTRNGGWILSTIRARPNGLAFVIR